MSSTDRYCHYCGHSLTTKWIEGRNRFFCETCQKPVYQNPIPATCVIAPDKKGRIYLVKRSVPPNIGEWCLPGGFMELNESAEACALRELHEETGLTGIIEQFLGVRNSPSEQYTTILIMGYSVHDVAGTPVAGDDAESVAAFGKDQLPPIAFDSHQKFLFHYLKQKSGKL